jgi:hypothetical protein
MDVSHVETPEKRQDRSLLSGWFSEKKSEKNKSSCESLHIHIEKLMKEEHESFTVSVSIN